MNPCKHFQPLMLDYLYEVLDRVEAKALQGHLDDCGQCRAALTRAETQKQRLSTAAKKEFPKVEFKPPVEPVKPIVHIKARWETRSLARWAVAAGILLVLTGLSVPGMLYSQQQERVNLAQREVNDLIAQRDEILKRKKRTLEASQTQFDKIKDQIAELERRLKEDQEKVRQNALDLGTNLVVTGPGSLQPGANNHYTIQADNGRAEPVEGQVSARVLDRGEMIFEQKQVAAQGVGKYRLTLPADLAVTPKSDLTLEVVVLRPQGGKAEMRGRVNLSNPVYVTHLATDRPVYRPGDSIYYRSLTLERFSLKPVTDELSLEYALVAPDGTETIIGQGADRLAENGELRTGPDGNPLQGIGAGQYQLPRDIVPGYYTLLVRDKRDRIVPQARPITVRASEPEMLADFKIERSQKEASMGVSGDCRLVDADGKPYAKSEVKMSLEADGHALKDLPKEEKDGNPLKTDAEGRLRLDFKVPANSKNVQVRLAVERDGKTETVTRTLDTTVAPFDVKFYPEGGDLIAGVPNRVYFEAKSGEGTAARFLGIIVDDAGSLVCDAATYQDDARGIKTGMGAFQFVPQAGKMYRLKVESAQGPSGGDFKLPDVKKGGVALSVPTGVTTDKDKIRVKLHSPDAKRTLHVGLYCRGRLLDQQRVAVADSAEIEFRPSTTVGGVYRVTVFEEISGLHAQRDLKPVAERLIYRAPAERLRMDLDAIKERDKVALAVHCRDEMGRSKPAVMMVAVVNPDLLQGLGDATSSMPTHFLLTTEVRRPRDLEDADFLLSDDPRAAQALDLLLGTQGWRRFAEQNPDFFREKAKEIGEEMLVWSAGLDPSTTNLKDSANKRLHDDYDDAYRAQVAGIDSLEDVTKQRERDLTTQETLLTSQIEAAKLRATAEAEHLGALAPLKSIARDSLWWIMMTTLAAVIVLSLAAALRRVEFVHAVPYYVTATCALLFFIGMATISTVSSDPLGEADKKVSSVSFESFYQLLEEPQGGTRISGLLAKLNEVPKQRKDSDKFLQAGRMMQRPNAPPHETGAITATVDRKPAEDRKKMEPEYSGAGSAAPALKSKNVPMEYREFAAKGESKASSATLYWSPAIVTDGMVELPFVLPSSVSRLHVTVAGHSLDGRLGARTAIVNVK